MTANTDAVIHCKCELLQVQVRQDKINPTSSVETPVNLGTNALTLVEIKLSSKQQMKRLKRKKKAGNDDGSQDDEPADDPGDSFLTNTLFLASL